MAKTIEELKGLVPVGFNMMLAEVAGFLNPRTGDEDAATMQDRALGNNRDLYDVRVIYDGRNIFFIEGESGTDIEAVTCDTLEDVMEHLYELRDSDNLCKKWASELIDQLENKDLMLFTGSQTIKYALCLREQLDKHAASILRGN